ncbi:MAG: hypothetical protein C4524_12455 [Candidatus Zixiibacteriota bacterium]|nr:MAG: hypothetical protein C4524_12455 [candidate division Zixibacteria bacterium]
MGPPLSFLEGGKWKMEDGRWKMEDGKKDGKREGGIGTPACREGRGVGAMHLPGRGRKGSSRLHSMPEASSPDSGRRCFALAWQPFRWPLTARGWLRECI